MSTLASLDTVGTRDQAIEYLEGYTAARKDELDRQEITAALLKSYLLETVPRTSAEPDMDVAFGSAGLRLDSIGDGMFKAWSRDHDRFIGLVERLIPRYLVLYTNETTDVSDRLMPQVVGATPFLDHLWLSGRAFNRLWEKVVKINSGRRYGRLVFEHESVFETDSATNEAGVESPTDSGDGQAETAQLVRERRASRLTIVDRLSVLDGTLPVLQKNYAPLYSISQLRFPATGRGGHDFYYNGKVTNRSDSFADHRAHLLYVLAIYRDATAAAEDAAWYSQESTGTAPGAQYATLRGAPVLLRFSQELAQDVFDRWISSTFGRRRNRFRLWGEPIHLGPGAVHVYGADQHLWQPLFLEITRRHLLAVLPRGTCGNTIHRLVTNVQHFIDPAVMAWVGEQPYDEFIQGAAESQKGGIHDSGGRRG